MSIREKEVLNMQLVLIPILAKKLIILPVTKELLMICKTILRCRGACFFRTQEAVKT